MTTTKTTARDFHSACQSVSSATGALWETMGMYFMQHGWSRPEVAVSVKKNGRLDNSPFTEEFKNELGEVKDSEGTVRTFSKYMSTINGAKVKLLTAKDQQITVKIDDKDVTVSMETLFDSVSGKIAPKHMFDEVNASGKEAETMIERARRAVTLFEQACKDMPASDMTELNTLFVRLNSAYIGCSSVKKAA